MAKGRVNKGVSWGVGVLFCIYGRQVKESLVDLKSVDERPIREILSTVNISTSFIQKLSNIIS